MLNKTKTYLCGPIEAGNGRSWREKITEDLKEIGVICYDPYNKPFEVDLDETEDLNALMKQWRAQGDYDKVTSKMKDIRSFDLALVDKADFIIAYFDPSQMTCGTWEEVFWANRQKKPIFFVVKGGKKACPLWMFGTIPHKYIYESFEEVLSVLKDIDSGKILIDSKRWRLLKESFR